MLPMLFTIYAVSVAAFFMQVSKRSPVYTENELDLAAMGLQPETVEMFPNGQTAAERKAA